jgi:hypothetical protein
VRSGLGYNWSDVGILTNIQEDHLGQDGIGYGHNPAALQSISRMTSQWHSVCVTGVITMPGDRSDELIAEGGRVAGDGFDKIRSGGARA